jgi:hypothetical protein
MTRGEKAAAQRFADAHPASWRTAMRRRDIATDHP